MLYAYTSATGNNGSAFAGLTGNTFFYNLTLASAMFVGRFFMIIPAVDCSSVLSSASFPSSAGSPSSRRWRWDRSPNIWR
jgi:K+-transporting ATPase ATPase A chain